MKPIKRKIYYIAGFTLFLAYVGIMAQVLPMGAFVPPPAGSPSVGAQYAVNVSDGAGSWLDSGCNILPVLPYNLNCPALTYTNTAHSLGGWQYFPDTHYSNSPVGTYPIDALYTASFDSLYSVSPLVISAASWTSAAGGTIAYTVSSNSTLTAGSTPVQVIGVNPSGYNNPSGAGWAYAVATLVGGTQFTFTGTGSDPGTYVSGGTAWIVGGAGANTGNRVKVSGGMAINTATSATATPAWNTPAGWESDFGSPTLGSFPITGSMNLEASGPSGIGTQYTVSQSTACVSAGGDCHLTVLNTTTGILYEAYNSQSNSPPYLFGSVAVWNTRSNALRTNYTNLQPPAGDTAGITSADVWGGPIAPLVLTHTELYSGNSVTHPIRITLPQGSCSSAGGTWPAAHWISRVLVVLPPSLITTITLRPPRFSKLCAAK